MRIHIKIMASAAYKSVQIKVILKVDIVIILYMIVHAPNIDGA